jgi:RNA polymerase sigma factor (sigma-70 family)
MPNLKSKSRKLTSKDRKDLEINNNIGLVHRIAQQYKGNCSAAVSYLDLVQEGAIGLIEAQKRFDPNRKIKFSTYANYWIVAYIKRALDKSSSTIHVTYSATASYNALLRKYGIEGNSTTTDIMKRITLDYSKGKINYRNYVKMIAVLMAKSPSSYNHVSLQDSEWSSESPHPLHVNLKTEDTAAKLLVQQSFIQKILDKLTPQERKLVILYYGLDGKPVTTYSELAKKLGCSRQKLYQMREKTIHKMRDKLQAMYPNKEIDLSVLLKGE